MWRSSSIPFVKRLTSWACPPLESLVLLETTHENFVEADPPSKRLLNVQREVADARAIKR
jgi:hypothetical protein